jgi:hypothetical protein
LNTSIGGYAVSLHGKPRFTKDFDIWVGENSANLRLTQEALVKYGAPDFVIAHITNIASDIVWMGAQPSRVEIFKRVLGGDFPRAYATRAIVEWDGLKVSVVGRDELLSLKRAAGRPQDLADIANLEAMKK